MGEQRVIQQRPRLRQFLIKSWIVLAVLFILMAIIFTVFRAFTPWARQYKPMVEAHLSSMLGRSVVVQNMQTSWYWFHPVLRLEDVSLSDNQAHTVQLKQLSIGIDILRSLWNWDIQPGIVYFDQSRLVLQQLPDRWVLNGLNLGEQQINEGPETYLSLFGKLSSHEKIVVRHVAMDIHLLSGKIVPLKHVNLIIQNKNGRYLLKGTLQLNDQVKTECSVTADLQFNPQAFDQTQGHLFLSVKSFLPKQWQALLPPLPVKILDGEGDVSLWVDIAQHGVQKVQSILTFRNLSIAHQGHPRPLIIESIAAHFGAKQTKSGWEVNGDRLQLQINGTKWPENKFSLQYDDVQQAYRVYVKNLLLGPLFALDLPWVDTLKPIIAMKPEGQLSETELHIKQGTVNYFLSRFRELSWAQRKTIPAVKGLSGVIYWQPKEGRLELDSYQTSFEWQSLPAVNFAHINLGLDWKTLSLGTRVSLDHFLLQNPALTLTANGTLDEFEHYPDSSVKLETQFSASHLEQWLPYIPSHVLKEKLEQWLKKNIKVVSKASGQMMLEGNMVEFPFDKAPGTFSILAFVDGVELKFAPNWPLTREVDAYLHVDKRQLEVDIRHANFQGVDVENMNLRIDDLGLGYETLLLHGKLETAAEKLLAYVMATPLKTKLARLASLNLKGMLGLDLNLEIPLYPENDDNLVKGEIALDNNQAVLKMGSARLIFDKLTGMIDFNENGIMDSQCTGTLANAPVSIHFERVTLPQPSLQVTVEGSSSIQTLQHGLKYPLLTSMTGLLDWKAILLLAEKVNESDRLTIQSSLNDVAIHLPPPLGKAAGVALPLNMILDLQDEKNMRLRLQYDDRLSADLLLQVLKKKLALNRGDIHIGGRGALAPNEKGLKLSGRWAEFDVKRWNAVMAKLPRDPSSPLLDSIRWVDMSFDTFNIFHRQVKNLGLKATQFENHEWAVQIQQKDLVADVRYQPQSFTLSGQVAHLRFEKSPHSLEQLTHDAEKIAPSDIPNLHLTIQRFIYDDVDIGQVVLNSKRSATALQIESFNLSSPFYNMKLKGNWVKNNIINRSDIEGDLAISQLGKSLERFQIKTAIEAHKGTLAFTLNWPGSYIDFALPKVEGETRLLLKGGRITDLGSAAEGKIGFGKLLNIFSLQTIPRRLQLDFSDLSQNGYSFDEFKGNFHLKNGVLSTQNSSIDGPVASVSMKGDIDLIKQLFLLDLYVSPHVMASLPVVATIAGGPIAGIATWAASKIINQGISTVNGYRYKVSGPWRDPVVKEVRIDKKRVNL
jgi:uncharacterized protein (TIGR02099 family)